MSNFLENVGRGIALKMVLLVVVGTVVAVLVPFVGPDAAGGIVFGLLWAFVIVGWIVGGWLRHKDRQFEEAVANSLKAIPGEILPIVRRLANLQPVTDVERRAAAEHYDAHPETHDGVRSIFFEVRRRYINDQTETLIQVLLGGKQLPKGKVDWLRQYFDLYPGAREFLMRAHPPSFIAVEKALQAR